ncbi:MAG: hypothetical protein ABSB29_01640 [Nitrososphaerales archaeon]|jgi:phenylacetate-CoA ligase
MLPGIVYSSVQAMKNYRLSQAELERMQMKKLRWMLKYCYDYIPLYHERFREKGLTPEDIGAPKDLGLFPTLSRETLSESSPGRIMPSNARVASARFTSGTTGHPIRLFSSPGFQNTTKGLEFRQNWVDGVRPWHKAAVIWTGSDPESTTSVGVGKRALVLGYNFLFRAADLRVIAVRQLQMYVSRRSWKYVASSLCSLKPDIIYARPSHARRLGIMLEEEGRRLTPKILLTASEFMSKAIREDLGAFYEAEVFDVYGSNELGLLGFECPQHTGTHLNSDCNVFEVLRDGEEVSPGEAGEIVITGLHNEAMPLIRYEQGDRVLLAEGGKCDCGSYLPRLRAIQGRQGDGLMTAEGARIPPGLVCDQLERVLGMRDFQLTQKDHQHMKLRIIAKYRTEAVEREVSDYLKSLLGDDLTLEVEEWTRDEMPAKYRPVVSEIARVN